MKIKVCGIKNIENAKAVASLQPDFMGFIFYPKSKRFVGITPSSKLFNIPENVKSVGVFVNETVENILRIQKKYKLDYIQLHGDENTGFCQELKEQGCRIIKAFQIHDNFDFAKLNNFRSHCEYLLLDTATKNYGGSGKKFDWKLLNKIPQETAYILSGGISPTDNEELKSIAPLAIDLNSKFEDEPGMKNIKLLKTFIENIRNEN